MGKTTKIDWCKSTWNPVTGCLKGCAYCYAQKIAHRFNGMIATDEGPETYYTMKSPAGDCELAVIVNRQYRTTNDGDVAVATYPFGFMPTLHKYLLDVPTRWKEPQTIFVCSMADLFGDWVPDEWIQSVFDACAAAPQHRYMFLTKNPGRYLALHEKKILPAEDNFWFGTSINFPDEEYFAASRHNCFLSIEPIMENFTEGEFDARLDWVIVGAETGNRANRVKPEKAWISNLVEHCGPYRPVFMKESLRDLMGEDFIQQIPWEVSI